MLKRKKIVVGLIISMCILGIAWSSTAFAFPNEPMGFRGNKWGTAIKDVTFKTKLVESLEVVKVDIYAVLPARGHFDELVLSLDGKMVGVIARLRDRSESNITKLATVLLDTYGPPTSFDEDEGVLLWIGERVLINFSISIASLAIGDANGLMSVESLLEWYASGKKI